MSALPSWKFKRVAVFGDAILDHFSWGDATRISPEAPVPVVLLERETYGLGGAANVAANVQSMGGQAAFYSVVGDDAAGDQLELMLEQAGIKSGLLRLPARMTTVKHRILAQGKHMLRLDREFCQEIAADCIAEFDRRLAPDWADFAAIAISDYAKGLITAPLLEWLSAKAAAHHIPLLMDPKRLNLSFAGVSVLKPNRKEMEMLSGASFSSIDALVAAGTALLARHGCQALLVTLGGEGMLLMNGREEPLLIPTVAQRVADVTGAGDTTLAALALGLAAKLDLPTSARLANVAAGLAVSQPGTVAVAWEELVASPEFEPALAARRSAEVSR